MSEFNPARHNKGSNAADRPLEEQRRLMQEYEEARYSEVQGDEATYDQALGAREQERLAEVESKVMDSAVTRRLYMLAQSIGDISTHKLEEGDDVVGLENQLSDKENKLQEMLVEYMESGEGSDQEKDEVMNFIVDATRQPSPISETTEAAGGDLGSDQGASPVDVDPQPTQPEQPASNDSNEAEPAKGEKNPGQDEVEPASEADTPNEAGEADSKEAKEGDTEAGAEEEDDSQEAFKPYMVEFEGKQWEVIDKQVDPETGDIKLHSIWRNEKNHVFHQTVDKDEVAVVEAEDADEAIEPLENEATSDEVVEPLQNENTIDDGAEPLENHNTDQAVEPLQNNGGEGKVSGSAWAPKDNNLYVQMMRDSRGAAQEARQSNDPNKIRRWRRMAVGAAAVAAVFVTGLFSATSPNGEPGNEAKAAATAESEETTNADEAVARELPLPRGTTNPEDLPTDDGESIDITEALNIDNNEGWNQTMKEMAIPETEWSEILTQVGPELGEMTYPDQPDLKVAYFDAEADEWRINMPESGKMPQAALDLIEQARSN